MNTSIIMCDASLWLFYLGDLRFHKNKTVTPALYIIKHLTQFSHQIHSPPV